MVLTTSTDGDRLNIKINSITNFRDDEKVLYFESVRMLDLIVNSKEFVQRFLALKLTNTEGLTNHEILAIIYSGREELQPIDDREIDVDVTIYESNNSTVGYTNQSTIRTWVNRKFFRDYTAAEVAGNLFHEWVHKLGFGHRNAKEHTSVPYAAGYLVRDMIREMMNGFEFTKLSLYDYAMVRAPIVVSLPPVTQKKVLVCRRRLQNFFRKVCTYEYENQEECDFKIMDDSCY